MATILLLALTVTLFASIFAFVTQFPSPPSQNNNQFQASLIYTGSGLNISTIQIVHLAGPSIPGLSLIYLKSATQPNAPEFTSPLNPYTVSSGLGGANTWNLGQVWSLTFASTQQPSALGNITVYIVSASQLVFSIILPGSAVAVPPTVVSTWIAPANPAIGQGFTVNATLAGSYTSNSVYLNLGSVPGAAGSSVVKMTQNGQGVWGFVVNAGNTTKTGTFYGFVNASNAYGQTATGAVVITISSTGSSNGPLSVGVILIPSPPNTGTTDSVQAVVTYTGSIANAGLTVSFAGTSSPSGYTFTGAGPSGITISGPSSVTVVSLSTWTIPNPSSTTTFTVTATAVVAGVGTVTGSTSFTPALLTASPATGLVGSSVTVTGFAFSTAAGSTVTLTMDGIAVTPSSCGPGTLSGPAITPAAGGGFVCTIAVPNGATGSAPMLATDAQSGQNDTAAFTVTAWALTVSPTPGPPGIHCDRTRDRLWRLIARDAHVRRDHHYSERFHERHLHLRGFDDHHHGRRRLRLPLRHPERGCTGCGDIDCQ